MAGRNFHSDAARSLFQSRREEGWGIDPATRSHMTSSQGLLLNILGPLDQDRERFATALNAVIDRRNILRIVSTSIEYAPKRRSLHLGDQTRIDALLTVETSSGLEVIAVEVKYADRLSSRRVGIDNNDRYAVLAAAREIWRNPASVFAEPALNQLARVHALAESTAVTYHGPDTRSSVLMLSHPEDTRARTALDRYRSSLWTARSAQYLGLDEMLSVAARTSASPTNARLMQTLFERYGSSSSSEALWQAYREAPATSRPEPTARIEGSSA